jgi:pyruvate dehydrogenase E1 component alpha subunit
MKPKNNHLNISAEINKDILFDFLEKMYLIRSFETKLYSFAERGKIFGSIHLCIGEEATAVGVCANLKNEDYIITTHRGHGQALAKGSDVKKMMAEMMGKKTGLCKGRVGSMHVADRSTNNLGAQGIIGATFPIATGVGLALKLKNSDRILAAFFGDGSTNQGNFYESLSISQVWEIPVVFVCVNNLYGMGTHYNKTCSLDVYEKGKAFKIPSIWVDGNDVIEIYLKTKELIEVVRKKKNPALLELRTYRWLGHSAFDRHPYRTKEEIEYWKKSDPIKRLEDRIMENGPFSAKIASIKQKVDELVGEAAKFAEESSYPELEKTMEF